MEHKIRLSENLRLSLNKMSKEIRESGADSGGNMQVNISDGTGLNSSDIITFSVPVICEAGGSIINSSGDVANWGAGITWGCNDSTCFDADDDCSTVDYQSIRYLINNNNQLVRRVLDNGGTIKGEAIFAQNISDVQASISADNNVVTLTVTALTITNNKRTLTESTSVDIYLRNKG